MKLINSVGPNPKVVRMFVAERGINVETVDIDLMAGENRQPDYLTKNPSGTTPALQLDDGSFIAEITAICEYLDDKHGNTDLIGTTPEARAETRMWSRRIDLQILENLANGFRYSEGLQLFQSRLHCIPQAADDLKALTQERLTWLDGQMDGKQFVCGDRFTLADILLFCFLEFGEQVGQPINTANKNISAWYAKVKQRPSAAA
ncbi:MAG: glutathione S-transferase family protein [Pseudomonadales bacterium]|nr:glutathione S-transferase family protein [Pseudomonadales bacterium]MDP5059502.1 glutathione S-transferase family protein [Pseudomonadales bacterium]